ncbi:MAG: hypothetical protein JSV80_05410 [Acidobacteriota bacterium]|nr:MAG: hypothetical protein JSV80_05410 [Acidobacteriota bacterium]
MTSGRERSSYGWRLSWAVILAVSALGIRAGENTGCPADGAARGGADARTWADRAQGAAASGSSACVAKGVLLADFLDRSVTSACHGVRRASQRAERDEDVDLLALEAALAWRCGWPRQADAAARAALVRDERAAVAWSVLGALLEARLREQAAKTAYSRALEVDPEDTAALWGLTHLETDRPQRMRWLERFIAAADTRGEPFERRRAARETIAFLEALGDREVWKLARAELPASLELEPWVERAGSIKGWLLRCRLGERKRVPALLDSGASGLHLDPRLARKAAMESLSEGTLFGGGGSKRHAVERGIIPLLDFGPLAFEDALGVAAAGSLHRRGLYRAIVGLDLFGGLRLEFDARGSSVWLEEAEPADDGGEPLDVEIWPRGEELIPLFRVEGQLLIPIEIHDDATRLELLALLDTGAASTFVDLSVAEQQASFRRGGQRQASAYGGARELAGTVGSLDVVIGAVRETLRDVLVIDLAERARVAGVRVQAFVGMDLLGRRGIAIDLASGYVQIERERQRR